MFEKSLIVKYVATQTCFLYVPNSYKLDAGKCIKICYGTDEKLAYLSVSVPAIELEHHTVGLNSKFAKALGVREGELVHISEIADLPKITNLSIVPTSKEDYDILELLAENVQNTLLEHIRVVNVQQKVVIWIGKNLWVTVIVENVHPVCPGMMTELTEVIIKPTVDSIKSIGNTCEVEDPGFSPNNKNPFLSSFLNLIYKKTFSTSNKHIKSTNTTFSNVHYFESIFRLIPLTLLNNVKCNDKLSYPFNVFLSKLSLGSKFSSVNSLVTPIFGSLNLLESSLNSPKEVFARVCFIEDCIEFRLIKKSYKENIFVSNTVFQYFQCTLGTRVILKQIEKFPLVNEIEIHSKKNYLENIVDKFKLYLANVPLSPFILNSEISLKLEENFTCSLKFLPNFPNRCLIDDDFLRNCKYSIQNEFVSVKEDIVESECTGQYILNVANFETIINESVDVFSKNNLENIIISGKPGTGKSSLIKKISQQLEKYPYLIYTETIHSKKVKGKTIESLSKMLTTTVSKLILCQPSVLILDDLHVLCENCTGEETPNSVYFNRISEMLHNFLKLICKCNSIAVLATVESVSKLNKHIYKSRGSHLFKNHFSITEFSKLDRKSLLKQMFNKHVYEDISFDDLALKTEGFVIQDITDFFNKVVFESYKDAVDIEDVKSAISISHCEKALKNTCVLSLQNVQLHANGTKSFKDIGGLHKVKDVLVESLLWPVQYPTIFSNAPLRLQSGILLYGPPGTGKTLLAGAAATHCALRLISIKGPELLSKYIGASEQAVRDVFEKAQSARPCILFFDEFDSLAPRRGHDNTGVTDRVVNQLLTQLDGVESLSGVCVLAATSRPDLLDPALLRPGRLDRQLLCGLPNTEERMEILQVLSKNLELADDVRLTEIADSTQGFSGADLQSILYTAQLSSVNYLFENENSELQSSKITQNHLTEALYKTRPSLTRNERLKYERIYYKFQGGVVEDFKTGTKATLA